MFLAQYLGNQSGTRCVGNYLVKGLYKAFPHIGCAASEPVLAAPEIHGPIALDESCRYILILKILNFTNIINVKVQMDC